MVNSPVVRLHAVNRIRFCRLKSCRAHTLNHMTKLQQELQRLQKLTQEFHKNVSQIADKYKTARACYVNRIGMEIKKFRVENRMKQRELASRIGINSAFLSFIENGDSFASTSDNVIAQIAEWASKNQS